MSAARPLRCLLSGSAGRFTATATKQPTPPACRASLHSSARLQARKSRFKSLRAEEMGLTSEDKIEAFAEENFRPYTPEELQALRKHYTPEQMQVLEAGEAAIDPRDLTLQGRLRRDPYKMPYLDDFSRTMPVIDRPPKKAPPPSHKVEWRDKKELAAGIGDFAMGLVRQKAAQQMPSINWNEKTDAEVYAAIEEHKIPIEANELDGSKFWEDRPMMKGNVSAGNSALAPGLGKNLPGMTGMFKPPIDPEDMGLDDEGVYQDVKRKTGLSVAQIQALTVKILVTRFVHNQTRLGKIRSTWILAIAGNENGRLGIGEAKSVEPGVATLKAKLDAIKNMQPIRRYEYRTIYGSVEGKVGATVVKLEARPPGFGLRASHRMFEMFRAVGLRDMAASMPRSRNPMNSIKACFQALMSQKDPDEIALGRGKKLVDVRKVYYGDNVL